MRKVEDFLFRMNSEFNSCNKRASEKAGTYSTLFCMGKINVMTVGGIGVSRNSFMSRPGENVNIVVKRDKHHHAYNVGCKHEEGNFLADSGGHCRKKIRYSKHICKRQSSSTTHKEKNLFGGNSFVIIKKPSNVNCRYITSMNVIGKFVSVPLACALLSANGVVVAPLVQKQMHKTVHVNVKKACCCRSDSDEMHCTCGCEHHLSPTLHFATYAFSQEPCASPVAAVSPNALDPVIPTQHTQQDVLFDVRLGKFSTDAIALLFGKHTSLFHPPHSSLFILS